MTNTATMTYSYKNTRGSLRERFLSYWRENSLDIMAAMSTISGNPVSFREYLLLKKDMNA